MSIPSNHLGWLLCYDHVDLHSLPLNDLRPHIKSPSCWCAPRNDGDTLWSHNAMDRREHTREQGLVQ